MERVCEEDEGKAHGAHRVGRRGWGTVCGAEGRRNGTIACFSRAERDDAIIAEALKTEGVLVEFEPMSPEEIQRTMQFLLQQQAQFAAGFERLSAKADRMMDAIVGLTAVTGQTVGIVGRLAEGQERLREAQERTDEQLRRTEANLDALINMFERHLREDHGRPPS